MLDSEKSEQDFSAKLASVLSSIHKGSNVKKE
jgi:hypothetical protein